MFYLEVPFDEKDRASGLGASYDGDKKKWYVQDGVDLEFFRPWIPIERLQEAEEIIKSQQPESGIKLSALLSRVKIAIDDAMSGTFWLNVEIAQVQVVNGNMWIQLAEINKQGKEVCRIGGVIWSRNLRFLQNKFKEETGTDIIKGLKVLIKVSVSYQIKNQMQLVIEDIDPSFTLGGIESKIKGIRDRVVALGLYDLNRNFHNPRHFKHVAVVSPDGAAGLGDFKADADALERNRICKFYYYTATFQGNNAGKQVSTAIKKASFDSIEMKYEAIVVIRGGGAKTDLHFLNEFDIAKEIANSNVPVFVGVGHERDRIFIDEIAFRTFDTPSKVIGHISNTNVSLAKNMFETINEIEILYDKLIVALDSSISSNLEIIFGGLENLLLEYDSEIKELSSLIKNVTTLKQNEMSSSLNETFNVIKNIVSNKEMNIKFLIDTITNDINITALNKITMADSDIGLKYNEILNKQSILANNFRTEIDSIYSDIEAKSPLNALSNGFAIIQTLDGKIITSLKSLNKEEKFKIWMKDGTQEFNCEEK